MANKNINELIEEALASNWDTSAIDVVEVEVEKAANVIQYLTGPQFRAISPWPRQIEFGLNLFEDYCPDCSDMAVVKDCWGRSLDNIKSHVTFLEFGKCPVCGKNRNHFTAEGTHHRVRELIGIAGQRCLDPNTRVRICTGGSVAIRDVKEGSYLPDRRGGVTRVKNVRTSIQPGSFHIYIKLSTDRIEKITCSDQHTYVTARGEVCAAELTSDDVIEYGNEWARVSYMLVDKSPCTMIDIETSTGTFLHESGLTLHNSGKTFLTAEFSAYLLHKLLCLEGIPCTRYGLINTILMGTFVAGARTQVAETTWGFFAAAIQESPWFKVYFAMLKEEERQRGIELFKFQPEGRLVFFQKRILFASDTSDQVTLRGKTRVSSSIDELGWFDSREGAKRRAGREVYRALDNSLQTIRSSAAARWAEGFYDLPNAYMFNVSSPSAEDDPIMTAAADKRDSKVTYIFHRPTWEINPEITLDSLDDKIKSDPLGTMRDFGAQPGAGKSVMFPNPETIYALVDPGRKSQLSSHKEIIEVPVKDLTYHYVKCVFDGIKLDRSVPYILTCDAGESNNSFSMMLASLEDDVTTVEGTIIIQPESVSKGKIATVHFPSVVDFIDAMRKFISLEMVIFDRWQSTLVLQGLRDSGVDARKHSLRYEHFKIFKQRVHEERIKVAEAEIPFAKIMFQRLTDQQPSATLIKQLRTVRDTGRRVLKPAADDDDLFRCLVLADYFLMQYKDRFAKRGVRGGLRSPWAVYHGNSNTVHQNARTTTNMTDMNANGVFIQKRRQ